MMHLLSYCFDCIQFDGVISCFDVFDIFQVHNLVWFTILNKFVFNRNGDRLFSDAIGRGCFFKFSGKWKQVFLRNAISISITKFQAKSAVKRGKTFTLFISMSISMWRALEVRFQIAQNLQLFFTTPMFMLLRVYA